MVPSGHHLNSFLRVSRGVEGGYDAHLTALAMDVEAEFQRLEEEGVEGTGQGGAYRDGDRGQGMELAS